jgi:hypothetical protein
MAKDWKTKNWGNGISSLWATTYNPDGRQVYSATWFGQIMNHGKVNGDKLPITFGKNDPNGTVERTKETIEDYRLRLEVTLSTALKMESVTKEAIEELQQRLKNIEGL